MIGGLVVLGLGFGLAATGTAFAVLANSDYATIARGCSPDTVCTGATIRGRDDAYHDKVIVASVLSAVGGVAMVAGGVLTWLGGRRSPKVALTPLGHGGALLFRGQF